MAEFTKEQLIEEVNYNLEHCFCSDKTKRLMEIALAALTETQLPQPAVLSVSEGVLKSLLPDVEKSEFWFEHNGKIFFEGVRFNNAVFEACRAAMLQAEPVSNSDELPLDYLQGHKDGLEWAAQLAEANHPQTGDWLYDDQIDLARAIRKGPDMPTVQGGNSPVIPDGWVMVPVELTPDMRAAWDSAPYTDDDDNDMQAAYRAMIAAAPQWKVK